MKFQILIVTMLLTVGGFAATNTPRYLYDDGNEKSRAVSPKPSPTVSPSPWKKRNKKLTDAEDAIDRRDSAQNGIKVENPEVYDDTMLQQMLREAELRLASMQMFDQASIIQRYGAVSGASQQISSFGLNIQGPSLPGVTTTEKGGTGSVVETDKTAVNTSGQTSSENSVVATNGLPTRDVATTQPAFGVPPVTAPAATTALPSTFSVASSKILNEQMQLTAQIQMLRMLLRGSLTSQFIKSSPDVSEQMTKYKTTLGIPVTVSANRNYKNAVAIVEVEVEKLGDVGGASFDCKNSDDKKRLVCTGLNERVFDCKKTIDQEIASGEFGCTTTAGYFKCTQDDAQFRCKNGTGGEPPMVTALLPQEKTYNVAAITDKSTSIGGGVVTQIVGVSGSWLRGHKTYYLTQDQDTVALSFEPSDSQKIGFLWQFRPVLGRQYAYTERKHVFVQLAFPAPLDAQEGEIGKIYVRTYWREYDYKKGVVGVIVPGSLRENVVNNWNIPRYDLIGSLGAFNQDNLEDLGGGQTLVNVKGRFLPGTFIRIGNVAQQTVLDSQQLRFVASTNDLAGKKIILVAPDGTERTLEIRHQKLTGNPTQPLVDKDPPPIKDKTATVTTVDEANSKVTVELTDLSYLNDKPPLLLVVGGRVFNPTKVPNGTTSMFLSAIVPTASLVESPRVVLTSLLAPSDWRTVATIPALDAFSKTERLVVMEQVKDAQGTFIKFLLYGNRLKKAVIVNPTSGAALGSLIADGSQDDTLRVVTISAAALQANKYLVLQRKDERPFLLAIPTVELKEKTPEPKIQERVTINTDEVVVEGIEFRDLDKVTFRNKNIDFEVTEDNKGIRLTGLVRNGLTSSAATRLLVFFLKSGAKPTAKLEVISGRFETISK